jgi:hypothetical protein
MDQIVHAWSGPPFSIRQAINVLAPSFSPQGTSPRFFNDWRWYKAICDTDDQFSGQLEKSYLSQVHNFLDYRYTLPAIDMELNEALLSHATAIYHNLFEMERGQIDFDPKKISGYLSMILEECLQIHPSTRDTIKNVIQTLETGGAVSSTVSNWWGRGQQYLSFIRITS